MAARQLCTFHLGDLLFGVDIRNVREVVQRQEMTRVPLAHDAIAGLINLRGEIVTVIDLRRRLGMPDRRPDQRPMNVVVRGGESVTSLLVDAIGDVVPTSDDLFEKPPHTLQGEARSLVLGAHKLPGRLLLELDTDQTVRVSPTRCESGGRESSE